MGCLRKAREVTVLFIYMSMSWVWVLFPPLAWVTLRVTAWHTVRCRTLGPEGC